MNNSAAKRIDQVRKNCNIAEGKLKNSFLVSLVFDLNRIIDILGNADAKKQAYVGVLADEEAAAVDTFIQEVGHSIDKFEKVLKKLESGLKVYGLE